MKKNSIFLTGIMIVLLAAGNSYGGINIGNDGLLDLLIEKGVVTEQEAKELEESRDGRLELSGEIFARYDFSAISYSPGTTTLRDEGVSVPRATLAAEYLSGSWKVRIMTDVVASPIFGESASFITNDVHLKNAFLANTFTPELTVDLGLIETPWVVYEEGFRPHKYVTDPFDYGWDSADMGIGASGKLAGDLLEYHLVGVNGGGYHKIRVGQEVDLRARFGVRPLQGLTFDLGYENGYNGSRIYTTDLGTHTKSYKVMATYSQDVFFVGTAYREKDIDSKVTSYTQDFSYFNLWGAVNVYEGFGVFARYEFNKIHLPSNGLPGMVPDEEDRYVLGIEYQADDKIAVALAWDHSKRDNYSFNPGATMTRERVGIYLKAGF